MKEIRRIIKEYKEAIAEPGMSDYHKGLAKIHAFDEIVAEVERIDILKKQAEEDITRLVSIIEPTLVALLSVVIGAVLLAVILPMAGILSSL